MIENQHKIERQIDKSVIRRDLNHNWVCAHINEKRSPNEKQKTNPNEALEGESNLSRGGAGLLRESLTRR